MASLPRQPGLGLGGGNLPPQPGPGFGGGGLPVQPRLGQGFSGGRASLVPPDPLSPRTKSYIRNRLQSGQAADVLGLATRGRSTTESYAARKQRLLAEFESKNLSPEAMDAIREFIDNRGRYAPPKHESILSRVASGLQTIEAAGAGFASGYAKWEDTHPGTNWFDKTFSVIAPWRAYHAAGAGFHNIGKSVAQHYTYDQFLKEENNPGSLAYKFSMPVGLGMSMLFDPTMYVTFGATGVSKTVAYEALRASYDSSYATAEVMVRTGTKTLKSGNVATDTINTIHGAIPLDYNHIDEIASHVRVQQGLPHDLPDALDMLREQGLSTKQSIRRTGGYYDPKAGEVVQATKRQKLAAHVLPTNVQGGRGVRFAGMQIPGTAAVGARLAVGARTAAQGSDLAHAIGGAMVPAWAARHVADDAIRGSLLVDMARYKTDQSAVRSLVGRNVRALQKVTVHHPDDLAAMNISGSPQSILIRPEQRVDLLTRDEAKLNPAQKLLKNNIMVEHKHFTDQAINAGIKDTSLDKMWSDLVDAYPDPLMSLAEYKWKVSAKVLTHDFTEKILKDRLYALPLATTKEIAHGADPTLLKEVPAGYELYPHGGRTYAVRSVAKNALEKINNPVYMSHEFRRGLALLNKPQNWWKVYATSPNPAFHVMNFLGATWNNLLAGVYNPNDYMRAMATLYQGRKEEAAQLGEKFGPLRRVPESSAKGKAAQQTLTEAENRAGLGRTGFLFGEISRGAMSPEQLAAAREPMAKLDPRAAEAAYEDLAKGRSKVQSLIKPAPGASKTQAAKFYAGTTPRRLAGVALAAHANPFALVMFAPELAKAGRRFGSTIEDVVRLAPFQKYANDPVVRQYIHLFGPIDVHGVQHPGFSKDQQRVMYDIGANISRHFQFDYSELTDFERYIAKSVFPFWTFYKKNFVLQAKEIARQPRKFDVALRLMNFANEQGQELGPYSSVLPQYFQNLQAFQIPVPKSIRGMLGLPKDEPLFLNPKMPFVSINLFPPLWNIINDPHETTSQKILETIAPAAGSIGPFSTFGAKIMLEAGTGHNLGLNRPLDYQRASSNDLRQSYVPAPAVAQYLSKVPGLGKFFHVVQTKKGPRMNATAAYILDQVSAPFINNLGSSIPISGDTENDRNKKRANLVSWLTGVRLMPADVMRLTRNDAFTIKDMLEAKQSELRQRNLTLTDDEYELLQTVKADLEVINQVYNDREGYSG